VHGIPHARKGGRKRGRVLERAQGAGEQGEKVTERRPVGKGDWNTLQWEGAKGVIHNSGKKMDLWGFVLGFWLCFGGFWFWGGEVSVEKEGLTSSEPLTKRRGV